MTTADPQIKERLSRAADPIRIDVESHLHALRTKSDRRASPRRVATVAMALVVAAVAVLAAWSLLPRGHATQPASDSGPTGTIAYMRISGTGDQQDSDLMAADAGTGAASPLLTGSSFAVFPVWSPDGTRVAFAMNDPGGDSTSLYVMNADGADLTRIGGGSVVSISWSPQGDRIAFVDRQSFSGSGLYVVTPTGSDPQLISPGQWESVSWSPDGQRFVLTGWPHNTEHGCPPDCTDIYTMRSDGGGLTKLTDDNIYEHYATWSPDGTKIVYTRTKNFDDADYGSDVFVMNADGTGQTRLTDWQGFDSFPVWSPDGRSLAFASDRGATAKQQQDNRDNGSFGGISLWVMAADGSDPRMLVDGGSDALAPSSWAP